MSVPNLKATTYRAGQKISCPYCQSIQVKAMSNQPRKYPYPEGSFLTPKKELEALRELWHKGYDCKKCGNEFIAIEWHMTPSWQTETERSTPKMAQETSSIAPTPNTPKKRGFFKTLFIILFWLIIGFLALAFFLSKDKSSSSKPSEAETPSVADQELKPLSNEAITPTQSVESTPEQQPPKQEEFTPQAEQNAHAYTPTAEDYKRLEQEKQSQKSIADSQSQNDTISVKTTLRNKSE